MNKKLKIAIAVGLVLKGAALVTASVINSYHKQKKYDEKFEKALDSEIKKEYLEEKAHEINKIYSNVKHFFEGSEVKSYLDNDLLNLIAEAKQVTYDFETDGFIAIDLEFDSLLDLPTKRGYYKIITRSDRNGLTEFLLRITVEDWDGYMDVKICDMKGYHVNGENIFIVNEKGNTFTMSPDKDKVFYYEIEDIDSENTSRKPRFFSNVENNAIIVVRDLF